MKPRIASVAAAAAVRLAASAALCLPVAGRAEPVAVALPEHPQAVDFSSEIAPALRANCLPCHNVGKAEGGLVMESVADMREGGDGGPAVVPGKPDSSPLFLRGAERGEASMPPADNAVGARPLAPAQLGLLRRWIEEGARGGALVAAAPASWRPLPAGTGPALAVGVSPDGRIVAGGRAGRLALFATSSGERVADLADPALASGAGAAPVPAHADAVRALAFDPRGGRLASGGYREVKLWRRREPADDDAASPPAAGDRLAPTAATWALERMIGGPGDTATLPGSVTTVAFSPDGGLLAIGCGEPARPGSVVVVNAADGAPAMRPEGGHDDQPLGVAFSPAGELLATAGADRTVRIFALHAPGRPRLLEGHVHHVLGVSWQADGRRIATASSDGAVKVWDVQEGTQERTVRDNGREATAVHFLRAGSEMIVGSSRGLRVVDAADGKTLRTCPAETGHVHAIDVSADGTIAAAACADGRLLLWATDGKTPPRPIQP